MLVCVVIIALVLTYPLFTHHQDYSIIRLYVQ